MILRGIDHMHSLKIMHRDIKLDNILYNSEEKILKICDFGISAFEDKFPYIY